MRFRVENKEFKIEPLINAHRESEQVSELIEAIRSSNKEYEVHYPLEEDVITYNDKWQCHISEKHGITFEFSNDRLCYLSVRYDIEELRTNPILHISDDIVNTIVILEENYIEYAFGSVEILSNEDLIPNRWSPIFFSLLEQISLLKDDQEG